MGFFLNDMKCLMQVNQDLLRAKVKSFILKEGVWTLCSKKERGLK
jgi:hypothetical protein